MSGLLRLIAYGRTVPRLGAKALFHNALYRIALKAGWYERKLPLSRWESERGLMLRGVPWKCANIAEFNLGAAEEARLLESANLVVEGKYTAFSWCSLSLPTDWQKNPNTDYVPPKVHWSRIPSLPGSLAGDIKWTWEASRFEWGYVLGRAWCLDNNPMYAKAFWRYLSHWRKNNPPQQGVNWMSGQESALKIFALVWGASLWMDDAKEEQRAALLETIALLAETIETVIGYALSQRNNHGLGEAVALYLVGSVLKGHNRSEKWKNRGFQLVHEQVVDQFASDGSYIQHSNNYTRVALRYASIYLTTAAWVGQEVPSVVRSALFASVKLLWNQQDKQTGQLPNYGANDGANPLPLNSCEYSDFRPILHCLYWQLTGRKLYAPGLWDEELLWVYAQPDLIKREFGERPPAYAANQGGYYVLRGLRSHALTRCTTLRSRPGHADMLHFDLWDNGRNLLSDGGTFQYVDSEDWGGHLSSTAAHNTIVINDTSQMTRGGRFLWLNWTAAKLVSFLDPEQVGLHGWRGQHMACEHTGYYERWTNKGVVHRRQILQIDDQWLIVDDLIAKRVQSYKARINWHLDGVTDWSQLVPPNQAVRAVARSAIADCEIAVFGHAGNKSWLVGQSNYPSTLRSRYYGRSDTCTLLSIELTESSSIRWITSIGRQCASSSHGERVSWQGLEVSLNPCAPITINRK